jgi:amino acid permease
MSTRPSGSMAPGQAQRLLTTQEMQYHQNQRSLSLASSYISVTGPRYFYTNQSLISCIGLIISSSLGVGMLTIPKAFSLSGWILGMVNILVCILIVYSVCSYLILLSYRVERVSYYGIAEQIFGRRIGRFCELGFAFTCYLVFVYYLYFLGKLPVEGNKKVNINNTTMNSSELWIGVFTVIVIPIAYFKSIDILKHTCWLSWLGAFVSLIGIIIQFFDMDLNLNLNELSKMPQDAKDYSDSFYLILFACTCQFNILAVYEEFGHRNKDKIKHVMRISLIIVTILYSIIGTLGYLMFNSEDHKTYIIENSFDTGGANNSGIYTVTNI